MLLPRVRCISAAVDNKSNKSSRHPVLKASLLYYRLKPNHCTAHYESIRVQSLAFSLSLSLSLSLPLLLPLSLSLELIAHQRTRGNISSRSMRAAQSDERRKSHSAAAHRSYRSDTLMYWEWH